MRKAFIKKAYNLDGVGPDAPVVENEAGGRQSAVTSRMDLLPPLAAYEVGKILATGAEKYGEWNWLDLSPEECAPHVIAHTYAYLAGDTQEGGDPINHLRRVACRALMWLELVERQRRDEDEAAQLSEGVEVKLDNPSSLKDYCVRLMDSGLERRVSFHPGKRKPIIEVYRSEDEPVSVVSDMQSRYDDGKAEFLVRIPEGVNALEIDAAVRKAVGAELYRQGF